MEEKGAQGAVVRLEPGPQSSSGLPPPHVCLASGSVHTAYSPLGPPSPPGGLALTFQVALQLQMLWAIR